MVSSWEITVHESRMAVPSSLASGLPSDLSYMYFVILSSNIM